MRFAAHLTLFVSGISIPGAQGIYEPVPVRDNEQQLMRSVAETEEQFARRGYRYQHPAVEALLTRIGTEVAPAPSDEYIRYRFHALRDPIPNAFAFPDGQVYVNTGMMALLDNEAELAVLLGHEATHAAGHHTILTYRSVRRKVVAGLVLGPLTLGLSDIFIVLSVYGYSRELEEEADTRGVGLAARAGYDPREAPRIFEILLEDPEAENLKHSTAWSTHPDLKDRVEALSERARGLVVEEASGPPKIEAGAYRAAVAELSLDTVADLIAADYPRSAVRLARRLVSQSDEAPRNVALGDGYRALGARTLLPSIPDPQTPKENRRLEKEKKRNVRDRIDLTRAEREQARMKTPEGEANLRSNLEVARSAYRHALDLESSSPGALRGLGFCEDGLGNPREAGIAWIAYLRASPEAPDRSMILERLKSINARLRGGEE